MSKILIITSSLGGGGAERVAVQIANGFMDLGDDVCVFALDDSGPYKKELHIDAKIIRSSRKKSFISIISLASCIRKYKPELIFCSQPHLGGLMLASRCLTFNANIKTIVREASTPSAKCFKGFKGFFLRLAFKWVYKLSDVVIAPCHFVRSDMRNFYQLSRDIAVLSNPVDLKLIQTKALEHIPENTFSFDSFIPTIIAVGRLHEVKNYPFLINAFDQVRKKIDCNLLILGEGDELANLQLLVQRLNLEKNITFLGFQSNPYKFIKNSSALVLTSLHEGLPNVLIQAGVLNTPAVSVNCKGGVRELLEDEFISENHNSKEFESILIDVLKNKASSTLRKQLQFQSNIEFASALKSLALV
jgi:glycosyltransferase involved in cell wall biosynthesis